MAAGTNHHPYFYSRAFSADERFLAIGSDRSGAFQIYVHDLELGVDRQLTDEEAVNTQSMAFGWTGSEIYYVRSNRIWAVDAASGIRRLVTDFSGLCAAGDQHTRPVFPRDMSVMYFYYLRPDGVPAVACADPAGGPTREVAAYPGLERIVHVLVNPMAPHQVTFDPFPDRQERWHLSRSERARCWMLDVRTGRTEPFLVAPEGHRATHEFWSEDGTRMYFHLKTVPGWTPVAVCSMDRGGGDWREHIRSGEWRLGHAAVDAGARWLVTDSQDPGRNPLILCDLGTGEEGTLCWPNASGAGHPRHVHPSFSPSGRSIVYTSDAEGDAHVWLVDTPCALATRPGDRSG